MENWYLYILECSDNSLYTGITKEIERRVWEHNNDDKKGAKSLKGKGPVKLVYFEEYPDHKLAARRERAVKSWTREYKLKLIKRS